MRADTLLTYLLYLYPCRRRKRTFYGRREPERVEVRYAERQLTHHKTLDQRSDDQPGVGHVLLHTALARTVAAEDPHPRRHFLARYSSRLRR